MTKENKERIPVLLIKCSVSNCQCVQTVYRVHTANVGLLTDVLYQSNTNRMIFPRALSPGAQDKVLQFPINASTLQCFYPAYCPECLKPPSLPPTVGCAYTGYSLVWHLLATTFMMSPVSTCYVQELTYSP